MIIFDCSDTNESTNCTCNPDYKCPVCSAKWHEEQKAKDEADNTVYKFTMEIKGNVPYASKTFGAYAIYEGSVVTTYRTNKQLTEDMETFSKMGGKVISIHSDVAVKLCQYCNSEVVFNYYDFNHECCKGCLETKAEEIEQRIKNRVDTLLLTKLLNFKPKLNSIIKSNKPKQ